MENKKMSKREDLIEIKRENLRELDQMIYDGKYTVDDMATELACSRRTIFNYINELKNDYAAKIETIGTSNKIYKYEDQEYRVFNDEDNKEILLEEAYSFITTIPHFEWMKEKAEEKIGEIDEPERKMVYFDANLDLNNIYSGKFHSFLKNIYENIYTKKVLKIRYKSFNDNIIDFIISPHVLRQYNNRWFLLGWDHEKESTSIVAIDRILEIDQIIDKKYKNVKDDYYDDYFDERIGVSEGKVKEKIKIKLQVVDSKLLPYIKTKPIHGLQVHKNDIIELELVPNYEFESLILSYGEKIRILEPIELVESMRERIKKMNENYNL